MKRSILIFIIGSLSAFIQCYGHDISSVHYKIEETENEIHVYTDLPWTLRYELETFDDKLQETKTMIAFSKTLKKYVNTHFKIWSSKNNTLELIKIDEIHHNNNEHTHGKIYKFIFKKGPVYKIENTILTVTNKKQKNINLIKINNQWKNFITNRENTYFTVPQNKFNYKNMVIILLGITSILGAFLSIEAIKLLKSSK